MADLIVASLWFILAAAHSGLGERFVITPLLGTDPRFGLPRRFGQRLVRFSWHAVSLAWVGLGAVQLGAPTDVTIAAVALGSGLIMLAMLRAHFAWPLFLAAGLIGLRQAAVLPDGVLTGAGLVTAAVLAGLGILHFIWAAGRPPASVIPTNEGEEPLFMPPPWLTVLVGIALLSFGAIVAAVSLRWGPTVLWWLAAIGGGVLALRAVGDFNVAGFTKRQRNTTFGRADDALYTPLVTLLAFGVAAACALG
jgi:hypothetical protein